MEVPKTEDEAVRFDDVTCLPMPLTPGVDGDRKAEPDEFLKNFPRCPVENFGSGALGLTETTCLPTAAVQVAAA